MDGHAAETPPLSTRRGAARAEAILDTAMHLFAQRGYHDVGIDEIGHEAGISGPGVYRHFRSKQELLAAGVWRGAEAVLAETGEVLRNGSPQAQLGRLVDNLIVGTWERREVAGVYLQEFRHLSADDKDRLRQAYLRYLDDWITVLRALRPELSRDEARWVVEGVIWMCRSLAFYRPRVEAGRVRHSLFAMAMAACLVPGA